MRGGRDADPASAAPNTVPDTVPDRVSDTICAVATGVGGALGIVRVSGPRAEALLRQLWPGAPREIEGRELHLAILHDGAGQPIDEALVCLMRAPRSYTGETVAELSCHGGEANLARVLRTLVAAGARIAEPGEFTRRAFLAGRIDLARAEAVAEVIAARNERALRLAHAHLRGALSAVVARLREAVVGLLAEVEASVDFPDERLDFAGPDELLRRAAALRAELESLASSYRRGRLLVDGLDVALVGRVNAGKSSLLNALAGEERALVDASPGTTRDFVEVTVDLGDVRATVVDMAGEREGAGALEARGLELGRRRRQRSDVVVLVVDGAEGFTPLEDRLLDEARRSGAAPLLVWNKRDLAPEVRGVPEGLPVVATIARAGDGGLSELRRALRALAGELEGDGDGQVVTSARQHALFVGAAASLQRAIAGLAAEAPAELVSLDLRSAAEALASVMGDRVDAEVLDAVFARFCIGK